jgi:phage shock protein A
MGLFTDIAQLFEAGYGWIFVVLLLTYEIYAPMLLNRDTALSPLLDDVPRTLSSMRDTQEELRGDVDGLQGQITNIEHTNKVQMQVQRAQARANPHMDEQEVDEYLQENGVRPDDFLRDETVRYEDADWMDNDGQQKRTES